MFSHIHALTALAVVEASLLEELEGPSSMSSASIASEVGSMTLSSKDLKIISFLHLIFWIFERLHLLNMEAQKTRYIGKCMMTMTVYIPIWRGPQTQPYAEYSMEGSTRRRNLCTTSLSVITV